MRDVADAFCVRAAAVRDESVLFKINAAAPPSVTDQRSGFDGFRGRSFDAVSIRLRPVETERDRDVDRVIQIVTFTVELQ